MKQDKEQRARQDQPSPPTRLHIGDVKNVNKVEKEKITQATHYTYIMKMILPDSNPQDT